ncbi:MAG: hypothetical protein HY433_01575 [Candidatus Liptonbacteria bacterium]|nr:hypothetical protein [Candidatus Liptonbacteria bacterium]
MQKERKFSFTAGELVEAEEKKEGHVRARKEAEFYRDFLDTLKNTIKKELLRNGNDIDTAHRKLKELGCNAEYLNQLIDEAMLAAKDKAPHLGLTVGVYAKVLEEMTPAEFFQHLEQLKASLAK